MQLLACAVLLSLATSVSGVNDAEKVKGKDKKIIIDRHNELRNGVDPPATNMQKVIWDEDVAKLAQAYANKCPNITAKGADILPPKGNRYTFMGQLMAKGQQDWTSAINGWYDEVKYFQYGIGSTTDNKFDAYQFAQVVTPTAVRIGCGYALCSGEETYFCNYLTAIKNRKRPYINGTAASDCGAQFKDGNLCDCGGKICRYGGTLDLSTCTCTCRELFTGPDCGTIICPQEEEDPEGCWNTFMGWNLCGLTIMLNLEPLCPNRCLYCKSGKPLTDPVVHINHPDGPYKWSFAEAQSECNEQGLTMATPKQLETAKDEWGMQTCACGWLADGSVQSMTQAHPDCVDGTEIQTCPEDPSEWGHEGWDVYCSTDRMFDDRR